MDPRLHRANADQAITVEDLVAVSGVAGRTLYKHFRLYKGVSPMAYLRQLRFDRVRRDLMWSNGAATVAEIAMRWGFENFGRFAGEYRRRYGERPSVTLRRRS